MQRQLHIIPDLAISSGGMGVAALRQAESLSKAGVYVTVFAASPKQQELISPTVTSSRFRLIHAPRNTFPAQRLIEIYRGVDSLIEETRCELIHLHGAWRPLHLITALIARNRRVPFVISPHGCLDDWAVRQKRAKKWVALKTYQGVVNKKAAMFFATSSQEVKNLRTIGISQPIATIPVGIDVDNSVRHVHRKGRRSILFLSRLHQGKGLLDLVEAWQTVRNDNWRIVIAGPDVDGHKQEVQNKIKAIELEKDFEFLGQVNGELKQACFENADLFILPSHSESFGISILEALAHQLPVITTTSAPWKDLQKHQCGWWVAPGVEGIASAIQEAMAMSPEALELMGHRGQKLVEEKYSWGQIAREYLDVYQWLLSKTRYQTLPSAK